MITRLIANVKRYRMVFNWSYVRINFAIFLLCCILLWQILTDYAFMIFRGHVAYFQNIRWQEITIWQLKIVKLFAKVKITFLISHIQNNIVIMFFIQDFLYFGVQNGDYLDVIAQFKDNVWSLYGNLQKRRGYHASITSGDTIMVIGGWTSDGS